MQRDHGLAGAGTAGDQHHALVGGPDGAVLLGLDRGHDRVHRAVTGAGELGQQRTLADDRQARGRRVVGVEQVVLDAEHALTTAAQDPPPDHTEGVGLRGLVEHRSGRRPPVDQHHVVVLVAQADPADVAPHVADLGAHVEAAEDQPLVGGVQGGHPAGSLEDHGVALHQAALVADPAPLEAFLGERAGRESACSIWAYTVSTYSCSHATSRATTSLLNAGPPCQKSVGESATLPGTVCGGTRRVLSRPSDPRGHRQRRVPLSRT